MLATKAVHLKVVHLAWPMMLAGVTQPLLGIVDTAILGHLEDSVYLGGMAVGATIISFVVWSLGFLRMSTTGLAAQSLGDETQTQQGAQIRAVILRAALLSLLIAAAVLTIHRPLGAYAFSWLAPSELVLQHAQTYYQIRIFGLPAALLNYVAWGALLGLQKPLAPLVIMVAINVFNIVFDLLLVFGFGMTIDGVAYAAVIAEYLGLAIAILLLRRELAQWAGTWSLPNLWRRHEFVRLLSLNVNILIRSLCLLFAFAFFTARGARFGDDVLAANALLLNFQALMAFALDGFAHATEALVGEAVGKKKRSALIEVLRASAWWSMIVALIFTLFYILAGGLLIEIMTDIPAVRLLANEYLWWMVLSPLVSVWAFWLDGVFIGATEGKWMRNTMLFALFVVYLPAWYVFQAMGNHGLWLALLLFLGARGITMGSVLKRKIIQTVEI